MEFFDIDETFIARTQTTAVGKNVVNQKPTDYLFYIDRQKGYGSFSNDGTRDTNVVEISASGGSSMYTDNSHDGTANIIKSFQTVCNNGR